MEEQKNELVVSIEMKDFFFRFNNGMVSLTSVFPSIREKGKAGFPDEIRRGTVQLGESQRGDKAATGEYGFALKQVVSMASDLLLNCL